MACKVLKFSRSNSDNSDVTNRRCEYGVAGVDYLNLNPTGTDTFEINTSFVFYTHSIGTSKQTLCMGVTNPNLSDPIIEDSCPSIHFKLSQLYITDGLGTTYTAPFTSFLEDGVFYRFILNNFGVALYKEEIFLENISWDTGYIYVFNIGSHDFYFGYPLKRPTNNLNIDFPTTDRGTLNCALCEFKLSFNQIVTLHVQFGKGYPSSTIPADVGSDVSLVNFGSRLQFGKQDAYVDNTSCCPINCTTGFYKLLISGIAPGNPTFSFSTTLTTTTPNNTKFEDCSGYVVPTTTEQIQNFITLDTSEIEFTALGAVLTVNFTSSVECSTLKIQLNGDYYCAFVLEEPRCCVRTIDISGGIKACCVELTEAQAKINTIHEFVLNNFGFTNINKLIGFSKIGASKYEEYLKALDELKDFVLFISLIYSDMACTGNAYTSYISDSEIQKFIDKFYCYNIDIKCILQMANIGNYTGCCEEVTHDTTCPCVDEVPTALPTRFITFNVNGGDLEQVNTEPVTFACCSGDTTVRAIKAKTSSGMPFTAAFEQYVQIGMYTLVINFDSDSDFAVEGTNGEINVTLSVCGKTVTQKYIINIINTCVDEYPNPLPLVTIPEIDLYTAVDNSTVGIISVFDPFSCCTTPPENPAEQTWEITGITIPSGSGFTYAPNLIGTTGTGNTASVTLGFNVEDANTGADQIYIYYLLCGKYSIRQDVAFSIIDSCETLPDPVITLDPPVDTTIDFNTVGETLVYTLDGLPEACCDDELITVEFVAILPTVDTPNPAAFNITIDTSNAPTSISVIYSGHSVSDLVASASFKYKIKLNVCGKEITVTPNLTFNFVGNCLSCGDLENNSATGDWSLSSEADDAVGQTFDFSRNGTYATAEDLETYDLGEFGKHVIMPFFAGGLPDGICLVAGYPPSQTALYSSFTKKEAVINSQSFDLINDVFPIPLNESKFGVGKATNLEYNGVVVTNDFYTNTSGVLFLRNINTSRFFSIGKMLDGDLHSMGATGVVYKPICVSKDGEPETFAGTFSVGTGPILSLNKDNISSLLIGDADSNLASIIFKMPDQGLYRLKLTFSGTNVVGDGSLTENNGIGFYGRAVNIQNNKTCVVSSGFNVRDSVYSPGVILNSQLALLKGLINLTDTGFFYSLESTPEIPNGMQMLLLDNTFNYRAIPGSMTNGAGASQVDYPSYNGLDFYFHIKSAVPNSLFILNLFCSNEHELVQEFIDLDTLHGDYKIELSIESLTI